MSSEKDKNECVDERASALMRFLAPVVVPGLLDSQPAEPRPVVLRLSPWTRRTDAPTHRRTPEVAYERRP